MKSKWKPKAGLFISMIAVIILMSAPAWSGSEEELITQFKEQAVVQTAATRVMVKKQGHVLFTVNPGDRDKVQKTMEDLALLYKSTTKNSEPIKVYFMISGGIAAVRTFNPGN